MSAPSPLFIQPYLSFFFLNVEQGSILAVRLRYLLTMKLSLQIPAENFDLAGREERSLFFTNHEPIGGGVTFAKSATHAKQLRYMRYANDSHVAKRRAWIPDKAVDLATGRVGTVETDDSAIHKIPTPQGTREAGSGSSGVFTPPLPPL